MYSIKRFGIFIIFLVYSISKSLQDNQGTLTAEYGRISNINNEYIYVSSSSSLTDCVRQCAEFTLNHLEYPLDDCFAYNYDMIKYSCELIHSMAPLDYTINLKSNWISGLKYQP